MSGLQYCVDTKVRSHDGGDADYPCSIAIRSEQVSTEVRNPYPHSVLQFLHESSTEEYYNNSSSTGFAFITYNPTSRPSLLVVVFTEATSSLSIVAASV